MQTIKIAFIGDFQISDNYPNTKNLISAVRRDERFDVVSCEGGSQESSRIYISGGGKIPKLISLVRMFFLSLKSAVRINRKILSECDVIYIPYPSLLVLLCYSFFGRSKDRPLVVVDCFISIYDTVVMDRKVIAEGGLLAKLLLRLEKRSIATANIVLADTPANAIYLFDLFGGEKQRYQSTNLCINESLFKPMKPPVYKSKTVLFVGSFVPLQGVDVVVDAAIRLADRTDIKFQLVGDGQTAPEVESQMASSETNIEWLRNWHSIEKISEIYGNADICLGVFGDTNKTYRVLPYKAYMAMACGKALISSRVDDGVIRESDMPFLALPSNSGQELASKIIELIDSSELREKYSQKAKTYYAQHLSNERAVDGLHSLLMSNIAKVG
ncbi:MAG: glycosyltransferase involved in cell wall biosynthesis [Pseudohongiellaceae bacterium]|jgi:glycosyltransferase involved in cell wall biosynthesis